MLACCDLVVCDFGGLGFDVFGVYGLGLVFGMLCGCGLFWR